MNEQILSIELKVQQVLKMYQQAQKENMQLQRENSKLKEQLQLKTEQTHQLQQKIDALKMSAGNGMDDKAKKDLERRINTYLKDIDKCLALLHS